MMDEDDADFSMDEVNNFLKDQRKKLENDKIKQVKNNYSLSGHEEAFISSNLDRLLPQGVDLDGSITNKGMITEHSAGHTSHIAKNKEPFINDLFVPKSRNCSSNTNISRKSQSPRQCDSVIDAREREKDRLADLFASSTNPFINNLNNERFVKAKPSNLIDNNTHCLSGGGVNSSLPGQKPTQLSDIKDYRKKDSKKYNIPEILVSEYEEQKSYNSSTKINDHKMVRIGEFSPLNPNHPAGRPILGVGEYDERRKFIVDQQRQEYNEYLKQLSRSHTPTPDQHDKNQRCREMATQTEWDEEVMGESRSARHCVTAAEPELCYHSSPARLSPIPPCLERLNEKEVKEQIYREELRKQIEEKHRLKQEIQRKEAEEEAKIEAKIQRDLEKMKRRLEMERLQRLEIAIRKKEQEDYLRQKLLDEQIKSFQGSNVKKKQTKSNKTSPPNSTPRQVPTKKKQPACLSQSLPTVTASKALSDVHEVLKQPLLEPQDDQELGTLMQTQRELPSRNSRSSLNTEREPWQTSQATKEVDMLVQEAALDPSVRSISQQTDVNNPPSVQTMAEQRLEVDKLLRQPLLPDPYLSPTSSPLLHATVAPVSSFQLPETRSKSPPIHASKRVNVTNSEILEDKWKVPYVERYNAIPPDVLTKHNRSVLTQLGAFRRHLQQERLRMQKRVMDESP